MPADVSMTGLALVFAVLAATPMSVDVRSADGFVLKGSYFSPGAAGPAIVLYHQCDSDRHVWDRLAMDLVRAGFHVLTFDSRGYGDSQGEGGRRSRSFPRTSTPPTTGSPPNQRSTSRGSPQEAAAVGSRRPQQSR